MTVEQIIEMLKRNYKPTDKLWFDVMEREDAEFRLGYRITETAWDLIVSKYEKDDEDCLTNFIWGLTLFRDVPMSEIQAGELEEQ